MSPAPDRGVDEDAGWHRREGSDDFIAEYGNVCERLDHVQPPDWLEERKVRFRSTRGEEGGVIFHRAGRGAAHGPAGIRRRCSVDQVLAGHSFRMQLIAAGTGYPFPFASSSPKSQLSSGRTRSVQERGFHSSTRSMAPCTSTSLSSPANARRWAGIGMRP